VTLGLEDSEKIDYDAALKFFVDQGLTVTSKRNSITCCLVFIIELQDKKIQKLFTNVDLMLVDSETQSMVSYKLDPAVELHDLPTKFPKQKSLSNFCKNDEYGTHSNFEYNSGIDATVTLNLPDGPLDVPLNDFVILIASKIRDLENGIV
jgi:hypothetical protein